MVVYYVKPKEKGVIISEFIIRNPDIDMDVEDLVDDYDSMSDDEWNCFDPFED